MTTAVALPVAKSPKKVVSRAAERYLSKKQGTAVPEYPSVYIFVNPTSGGNKAGELMKLGMEKMSFQDKGLEADVSIFDIREGPSGEKPAFMQLRDLLDSPQGPAMGDYVRVVVAGGDGTVMWVLQELIQHGINTDRVCIGIIPFGTGNDFSRATGWGPSAPSDFPGSCLSGFRTWLKRWLSATIKQFDIWEVEVDLDDDGGVIYQLKGGKKVPLTETDTEVGNATDRKLKKLVKPMCNYFSTGVES
ncbi:diacylglycerol kinase, putative, partial [Perkinsus marinus ATCC 50983]